MSPVREASLTALREIRRNLGSAKGIAMFVLFFLGGLLPNLWLQREHAGEQIPAAERAKLFEEMYVQQGMDAALAHFVATCPPALMLLFKGTLVCAPFVILLIGFDQISGDIQHRAIRYIAGRSRRETIVVGKVLGLWGVVAALVLALNLVVWIFTVAQGTGTVGEVLLWGPRVWLVTVLACLPWVGLISLVSSMFRTPTVALFVAAPVFFVLWTTDTVLEIINAYVMRVSQHPSSAASIRWALPWRYQELLMLPDIAKVLGGVGGSLAWGAVMVAITTLILKRRDV
jgi:ABC-type transport system involved in multi-copper enzyme maturation permease subunit